MSKLVSLFAVVLLTVFAWFYLFTSETETSVAVYSDLAKKPVESIDSGSNLSLGNTSQSTVHYDKNNTSLKGTDKDGAYPVDEEGNLLMSIAIKERFEYFLSTLGEFPLEDVLQMVKDDILLSLQSPAKEQALKLFDDYVAYKYSLAELEKSMDVAQDYEINDIERFRAQLDRLRDKRREYLDSDAVDAFFGFDEMYDDYMLARLEIQNNSQLTKAEKAEQIASLEDSLPSNVKDMREQSQAVSQAFKTSEAMREQGASDEEVHQYNAQQFGLEAADKLQDLDTQRAQWKARVQSYLQLKANIEMDLALTDSEKQDAINEMKLQRFSEAELKRLPAFEIIYGQQ